MTNVFSYIVLFSAASVKLLMFLLFAIPTAALCQVHRMQLAGVGDACVIYKEGTEL